MPNSVSIAFETAMKTGSSRRFKQSPHHNLRTLEVLQVLIATICKSPIKFHVEIDVTTLQSLMDAKLSQHSF